MQFKDVAELTENGFEGCIPVSELKQNHCRDVPTERGVYLVVRRSISEPQFLAENPGGHFNGNDPTVPVERLRRKWVGGTMVLYIGKAGNLNGNATLRSRIRQFMDFGQGARVGHWGGRFIWQLADSGLLEICWKETPNVNPRAVECHLIQEFRSHFDRLPFANLQGCRRLH